ncbi:MAG: MerR family transcriptional regulator [Bacteriovoracia bacterium]
MMSFEPLSMIPNKSNFKFQELTPITGVKPYVIRFWETEFPEIAPISSENGQKLYARKDVEAILKIKKLLFEDKLTIQEAKVKMNDEELETSTVEVSREEKKSLSMKPGVLKALDLIKEIKAKRNW